MEFVGPSLSDKAMYQGKWSRFLVGGFNPSEKYESQLG
jgi:hypothetical protein